MNKKKEGKEKITKSMLKIFKCKWKDMMKEKNKEKKYLLNNIL